MNRSLLLGSLFGILLFAASARARQYDVSPPAEEEGDESLSTPSPDGPQEGTSSTSDDNRVSLPYTPYPAGLSWVMTPQSFRVPIPDRIYYPPHHYVRKCPYYPRGYYWGANWRFNVIGRGNLLCFGTYRYNPYLTAAIAQHDPDLRGKQRYAAPPGPVGQAMLLGSADPATAMPLPPTLAEKSASGTKATFQPEQATVRKAPERRTVQTASSRRTAKTAKLQTTASSPRN